MPAIDADEVQKHAGTTMGVFPANASLEARRRPTSGTTAVHTIGEDTYAEG